MATPDQVRSPSFSSWLQDGSFLGTDASQDPEQLPRHGGPSPRITSAVHEQLRRAYGIDIDIYTIVMRGLSVNIKVSSDMARSPTISVKSAL